MRPLRASIATSCQKFASCSAVQIASLSATLAASSRAVQRQQQAADGIGRAAAIIGECCKRRVALDVDILGKCGEQVAKRLQRQRVRAYRVCNSANSGSACGSPRSIASSALRVAPERGVTLGGRGVAFVGDVVGGAREPVDRDDRRADSVPAAARRRPGNSRSVRPTRGIARKEGDDGAPLTAHDAVAMAGGNAVGYTSRFGTRSRRHPVGAMPRTRTTRHAVPPNCHPASSPTSRAAFAKVAELVDAPALGAGGAARGGSSPPFRTNLRQQGGARTFFNQDFVSHANITRNARARSSGA